MPISRMFSVCVFGQEEASAQSRSAYYVGISIADKRGYGNKRQCYAKVFENYASYKPGDDWKVLGKNRFNSYQLTLTNECGIRDVK